MIDNDIDVASLDTRGLARLNDILKTIARTMSESDNDELKLTMILHLSTLADDESRTRNEFRLSHSVVSFERCGKRNRLNDRRRREKIYGKNVTRCSVARNVATRGSSFGRINRECEHRRVRKNSIASTSNDSVAQRGFWQAR